MPGGGPLILGGGIIIIGPGPIKPGGGCIMFGLGPSPGPSEGPCPMLGGGIIGGISIPEVSLV